MRHGQDFIQCAHPRVDPALHKPVQLTTVNPAALGDTGIALSLAVNHPQSVDRLLYLVIRRGANINLDICYKIQYFITILFINM